MARKTPNKPKPKAKPAAKPKAAANAASAKAITLAEVVATLGVPFDDARLAKLLARMGRKPPGRSTSYIDAKPHGVSLSLEADDDGPPRVLELCLHVTTSSDAGKWSGDLPEGLTAASKPEHVKRGARTDTPANGEYQPAQTEFVIDGKGTKTFVVFADGVLEHVNIVVAP